MGLTDKRYPLTKQALYAVFLIQSLGGCPGYCKIGSGPGYRDRASGMDNHEHA